MNVEGGSYFTMGLIREYWDFGSIWIPHEMGNSSKDWTQECHG